MSQAIERIRERLATESHIQFIVGREALSAVVAEADQVAASRDRLFFEVQILQMAQGALKMEIDRLRAESAPTIAATGAEMTILADGTVRIKADCLSVNGDVVPA